MRLWTAALLLRLPVEQRSALHRDALETVVRAADQAAPMALRALDRALRTQDREAVWRTWLRPSVSGPSPRRWVSPLLARLLEGPVPDGSDPVPARVVDAAWGDWLEGHHAGLWSLVKRWNRPATVSDPEKHVLSRMALGDDGVPVEPRLVVSAAARFDHPIGEPARARLISLGDAGAVDRFCAETVNSPDAAAFCAAHHLAPSDEVERALFFVRTGQHEQYRALDPDGALLSLGYQGAPPEVRSVLRSAMTALGGIDVLRVLAGQRSAQDDFASLTEQERAYLVRRLTDQRDWDRLWPLIPLMPLAEAVEAVRGFDGRWFSGEDERRVLEALRAADPQAVGSRVHALSGAPPSAPVPHIRITLADLDERIAGVSGLDFAPDGTQLALAGPVRAGTEGAGPFPSGEPVSWAGIVDLGSRTLSRLHGDFTRPLDRVAHLGSDTMVVAEVDAYAGPYAVEEDHPHRVRIHYIDPAGVRALDTGAEETFGLKRIAGDRAFVVSASVDDTDAFERPVLFTGGPGGSLVAGGPLDGLDDFEPLIVAVDPDGRLVAMVDVLYEAVVADLRGSVVNRLDDGSGTAEYTMPPAALSPSTLVSCSVSGDLNVWHEPLTSTEPALTVPAWSAATRPTALAWSSALNRFLAVDVVQGAHLELLDVPPTRDAPVPDELVSERMALVGDVGPAPIVRLSPKGDVLAVGKGGHDTVDLYDLTTLTLRSFIAGPMGLMTHRDLAHVVEAQKHPLCDDETRTTLALLRTCLEHRFRHDVGIGGTAGSAGSAHLGDHEIELDG